MPEHLHKRKHLTSFQLIILGFAGVILIGALILTLPVSSASGVVTPFDQALFYINFSSMCDRTCCAGYRQLLVYFWTSSYFGTYTDWRFGSCNRCSISIYAVRTKNIAHAAEYDAGCYIGAKSRRYCPTDKIYSERDLSDRSTWSSIIVSGILS